MKDLFQKKYTEEGMWQKIGNFAKAAGIKVIHAVLLLFYAYKREETPTWAKNIVLGTLGYFIAPIDALPDLTPLIGFTDDLGVLSFGLVTIAAYINEEVKLNARNKLSDWFGPVEEDALLEIEEGL
ncbi:MAG: DUF1232 domain-containing protein [Saprospiraceae bacterium]|nr:DUF1232 domain-containing protein [Saprospiraceae bacterium]